MNRLLAARWLALFGALILVGCQTTSDSHPANSSSQRPSTEATSTQAKSVNRKVRNNCASLLYDLLNDEKNLGKILIIKRDSNELHQLVKNISTIATQGVKKLD